VTNIKSCVMIHNFVRARVGHSSDLNFYVGGVHEIPAGAVQVALLSIVLVMVRAASGEFV
jgi:hypothetical protein